MTRLLPILILCLAAPALAQPTQPATQPTTAPSPLLLLPGAQPTTAPLLPGAQPSPAPLLPIAQPNIDAAALVRTYAELRERPWSSMDEGRLLLIENIWRCGDVDAKGIFVTPAYRASAWQAQYQAVWIRNVLVEGLRRRDPKLHIDNVALIQPQSVPMLRKLDLVVIEDVQIRDSRGAMPIEFAGITVRKLVLRRICVSDVYDDSGTNKIPCYIGGGVGSGIDDVLVDSCPGIQIRLQGAPGSIGRVVVRRSPGAGVVNAKDQFGQHPGAVIIVQD